jgi:acyl transferase domain-containing protein
MQTQLDKLTDALRAALIENEDLRQLRARALEPVAVVGMACRFAGGIESPADLWEAVCSGADVLGDVPDDRGWDLASLFDPDPDAVGKTYTRSGAFLSGAGEFDAEFFGISPREAMAMDPQQRVLLEVCWEALEAAGIDPASLAGSETGVFAGTWAQPYGNAGGMGSDSLEGFALTGGASSVASGRIAYVLGLQGPAISIDTACSSSLVATHLACQSLRNGESSLALAGGVTVMTTPAVFTAFARQRGLAADGRCKAFAAAADGTGFGEGAAVLVLERLSDAHRNNHPVLAVIAGSAINQDGASNGLTAPNGPAQERLIVQAVSNAGIGLDEVDVVEGHGTGTTLGDPIEAGALIATYGAARSARHPLWLGSIKSNIGHTQAAAGAAGIIKMIAAINHDTLPPTLNVDHPSPHIDWSAGTVRILTEAVAWPITDHPRTAAVSSFGISGTNAHLILQQTPNQTAEPAEPTRHGVAFGLPMWPVSARTPAALLAQADRLHQHLIRHPDLDLTDVAYSLARTRTHHPYRAAITMPVGNADPRADLLGALDALRTGQPHPQLTQHHLTRLRSKTVFVLPGQGAQYPDMGRELYEHNQVFADTVDNICEALDAHLDVSLREIMFAEPGSAVGELIHQTSYAQPALFAMGAAMHALFVEVGITPDYLLGHSIGELTAAYIAGVFTLADAAVLVTARGRLMQACPPGAMLAIQADEREVEALLEDHPRIAIAAINGPTSVVVSGDADELEPIRDHCAAQGIRATTLSVSRAFHSSLMDPALPEFEAIAAGLTLASPTVPIMSNLTGQIATSEQLASARYWTRHLRESVRFHDSVVELLAAGECTFVELSPHPVLAPAITDTLAQAAGRTQSAVITTLHRDRPDQDSVATALAKLHNHGHSPSWSAVYPRARTVALPTYAFEHRRYWLAPAPSGNPIRSGLGTSQHQATIVSPRTLAARLATQTPQQRLDALTEIVTATTASVLAHPDSAALDPDRPFKDLGIDSLTALELRNSLNQHTGLTLPATLTFDHPTAATLATYLAGLLTDTAAPAVPAAQVSTPSDEPVANRLSYVDQAVFRTMRAVHDTLIQITWIYDRVVDLDGLRRFHRNLGRGLLGRRIERSPLPFARDRWVLSPASEDFDIAATPRPRADVNTWVDERARLPVDPEWGPGWHLGVIPLEDGGAAVSLVASHTVVDGVGFGQAIADAAEGRTHDLGYPPAGSRTRGRALREDLRQTVKDLPDVGRAVGATVRRAWPDRKEFRSSIKAAPPAPRTASNDQTVEVPALTAYIDLAEWDARAKTLGASSNSLVAGVACRLAVRVGRVHDDGAVTLRFPVTLRTEDDTRGNALTVVDVTVDPTHAAKDLGEMHVKITQAILAEMENADDEFLSTFPLAVMIPRWVNRRIAGMAAGGADLPVTVSNLGDLPPAGNRPDGTDADYAFMRNPEPAVKKSTLEHIGGQLFVGSGRGRGKIFFRISAYSLDQPNTDYDLREVISRTFAEFDLTAEIDC